MSKMNLDEFGQKLGATIAWCRPRFSMDRPVDSIRSTALAPPIEIVHFDDLEPMHQAVDLVTKRSAAMLGSINLAELGYDGRLFGLFVRYSLFDGVSALETNGY